MSKDKVCITPEMWKEKQYELLAKAEVIEALNTQMEASINDATYYYDRIQQMKDDQGEAFTEDSWEYRNNVKRYFTAMNMTTIWQSLINSL